MKQLMKIKSPKIHLHKISSLVFALVFIILGVASPAISHATGDAYFSLSPASGSYTVGNTIVLSVSETSTSGDNTNAAQVNLSYPTALLQYQSITLNGPFALCGHQTA